MHLLRVIRDVDQYVFCLPIAQLLLFAMGCHNVESVSLTSQFTAELCLSPLFVIVVLVVV